CQKQPSTSVNLRRHSDARPLLFEKSYWNATREKRGLTLKMSHAYSRRGSCFAGDVTAMGVGSGALLGCLGLEEKSGFMCVPRGARMPSRWKHRNGQTKPGVDWRQLGRSNLPLT